MITLIAILALLYYWVKTYSKARNAGFKNLGTTSKGKKPDIEWLMDQIDEIILSILATIILIIFIPFVYEWLQFKYSINPILMHLIKLVLGFLAGILNVWIVNIAAGFGKKTINKALKK